MKALLVLYMTHIFALSDSRSYAILGGYGALVYMTPLLGTLLVNRIFTYQTAIIIGCVLMMIGHITLALTGQNFFFIALAIITLGSGFAKPNLVNLVGNLYQDYPAQKESGFTMYYVGSNIGAVLAPIICGYVAVKYSFHAAFAVAGIGMLFGLLSFILGRHLLVNPPIEQPVRFSIRNLRSLSINYSSLLVATLIAIPVIAYLMDSSIYPIILNVFSLAFLLYLLYTVITQWEQHGRSILRFVVLLLFGTIFWAFDQQAASSLTLFTDRFVDRSIDGFTLPTATFQSVNPAVILIFGPLLAKLWTVLGRARYRVSFMMKFSFALLLAAVAFVVFAHCATIRMHNIIPSCGWIIVAYFIISIGELCCEPIGLTAANTLPPLKMVGLMITAWYLFTGAYSNYLASLFARIAAPVNGVTAIRTHVASYQHLFTAISVIAVIAAVVLLGLSKIRSRQIVLTATHKLRENIMQKIRYTNWPFRVLKFGGTSVADVKCLNNMAEIVQQCLNDQCRPLLVCSAPRGASDLLESLLANATTSSAKVIIDELYQLYHKIMLTLNVDPSCVAEDFVYLAQLLRGIVLLQEVSQRISARVMALGELMISRIIVEYLKKKRLDVVWLDARDWLISTSKKNLPLSSQYLEADCDVVFNQRALNEFRKISSPILLTQGFIAANSKGDTVVLGRGGSDTSAAYFSVMLGASRCEIWTDVLGIYSADPRYIPEARLLKQLDYDEAQEIASMGGNVLHPSCLAPLKKNSITLIVKNTIHPQHAGTLISFSSQKNDPQIKSILSRRGIVLITIETVRMWQQVGFLSKVFECFTGHGISIDLISTSESTVTVSLDGKIKTHDMNVLGELLVDLNKFATANLIGHCASISLVGHNIRTILYRLGSVFEVFEQQKVYLLSQAANDLNLTFVVDEDQALRLTQKLHALLIETIESNENFVATELFVRSNVGAVQHNKWWQQQRAALLNLSEQQSPLYVYDTTTAVNQAKRLQQCQALDRIFYAVKANPNPNILKEFYNLGLNFECVSLPELELIIQLFPCIDRARILFTPNFAPRAEYARALEYGVHITVDNLYILEQWPDLFTGHEIFIRIDPGHGYGHHKYVITGGSESKFGIPIKYAKQVQKIATSHRIKIVGLHAHSGSGILYAANWQELAKLLLHLLEIFKEVTSINLGGGLGIVDKPSQVGLDLKSLDCSLLEIKSDFPAIEFWIEPGRYLVAESGVLLTRVSQLKQKGDINFIGVDAGMNCLIRPALYGAYHQIVNLTRLNQPLRYKANIVGPICESSDVLGYSRVMPVTKEGDILLIANVGAYGYCMSSNYNLRSGASEIFLPTALLQQAIA